MKTDVNLEAKTLDDARLVKLGLDGNREAFGELVTRYQSPVCALAYSACGDISQSEDVAQETFVIAWRKLGDLKEAAKFKSWLFGIARNLLNSTFRERARNPLAAAEPLDENLATPAAQCNPAKQAISKEEQAILWRSLEQVPETYREPLILFYREHQSIERVAETLELTEEAARQRLSRGRKLLQERVAAFVEGALEQSAPGSAFTLGVLAALPALQLVASSSAVGSATVKGNVLVKATLATGFFALAKGAVVKFFPGLAGTAMMIKVTESRRERKFAIKAWCILWLASISYAGGLFLVSYAGRNGFWDAHEQILKVGILVSAAGYMIFVGRYVKWMVATQKRIQKAEAEKSPALARISQSQPYEYRSARTLLGLPLVHIRFNCLEAGKPLPAKGWIAMGDRAYGILFASGVRAVGCVSMGGQAIGVVALGAFGMGLFSFGAVSIGVWAMGGLSLGYLAFGGAAFGWMAAFGGPVFTRHFGAGGVYYAEHANDQAAQAFMYGHFFFRHGWAIFDILAATCWLLPPAMMLYNKIRRARKFQSAQATQ